MTNPNFDRKFSTLAPVNNKAVGRYGLPILIALIAVIISPPVVTAEPLLDISSQPAGSVKAIHSAPPAEISYLVSSEDPYYAESSTVRVIDSATEQVLHTMTVGKWPDLAISPDGQRLYLADIRDLQNNEDWYHQLSALDTATWNVIWETKIQRVPPSDWGRVLYIGGVGPSTLGVTPDGHRLFVYKSAFYDYWFEVLDTETGNLISQSSRMSHCGTANFIFSADGNWLYIACYRSNDVRFMNVQTLEIEETLAIPGAPFATGPDMAAYTPFGGVPGAMAGMALSSDGHWLYVVTNEPKAAIVNISQRRIERWVDLGQQQAYPAVPGASRMVALSADGRQLFIGMRTQGPNSSADTIRSFDTRSWRQVGEMALDIGIGQLAASPTNAASLYILGGEPNHRHHVFFTRLALSRPGLSTSLATHLANGEDLMRFFTGPRPQASPRSNDAVRNRTRFSLWDGRPDQLP